MLGLKSFNVTFMEPVEVVYTFDVDTVPVLFKSLAGVFKAMSVVFESIGGVVDAVPVVVESVDVVVDDVPVDVEPVGILVETVAAFSVVEFFSFFWVNPTLKPIVSATIAKPSTPS